MFLEKHLYTGLEISWPTIKYMISQAQYGGKVTDDMDKRLLCCYAEVLFTPKIMTPHKILKLGIIQKRDHSYKMCINVK